MKKPYYITTAIAYTSGKPHIGNTYEIVLADSIARFKRMQGYDVRFQTGTDEHGQKIELKAAEAGKTPKQFVDDVSGQIKTICVYSVTGKTRVNDTGEETFGLLCFAEITEFAKELHSEMEKVVLMDELPENWTYPLIQPKLIEKYLQEK